tara:strand:- start:11 stop:721 length:711 start_codon:yes stop_codon:yes gene_type:complete
MPAVRLQKIISDAGISSRRHAEKLIKEGRVAINGKKAFIGDKADPIKDKVFIDGSAIKLNAPSKVILINKPKGVISTCSDPFGRETVISIIPPELRSGLYPVGRLDQDSRGALLLTNNGNLSLKLTHPKYSHEKTYKIVLKGILSEEKLNKWRDGILLDGKLTMKAKVNLLDTNNDMSIIKIVLKEGRNRQIRRVAELLGHRVIDLQRVSISNIKLSNLKEGCWRILEKSEWEKFL